MAVLALCPTVNMLMRLKFQSTLLQNAGWLESPEWQHSRPPRITQYWMKMDGLPDPYENGVDFFEGLPQRHQRPQFRVVKTSIGPMTPQVLCDDDLSGDLRMGMGGPTDATFLIAHCGGSSMHPRQWRHLSR